MIYKRPYCWISNFCINYFIACDRIINIELLNNSMFRFLPETLDENNIYRIINISIMFIYIIVDICIFILIIISIYMCGSGG